MMCMVSVRQLKPGTYDEFREAWEPVAMPPSFKRAVVLRNEDNPDQVLTIGYFDVGPEEFDAVRDDVEMLGNEAKRIGRIAPFEQAVVLNGVFEVVDEIGPPGA